VTARIDRLWPEPAEQLSDDELTLAARSARAVLRVNFVSSIDGAATRGGVSGPLGDEADHRLFELLRRACDVVVVGAGTVRVEGYGPLRVSDASVRWRVEHGLSEHPRFAIVSGALDLDPAARLFTEAPSRPIIITGDRSTGAERFAGVAEVVRAGQQRTDPREWLTALHDLGLGQVLCEGGPTLFGSLIEREVVDELHLTVGASLQSGDARRISTGPQHPMSMRLGRVLRSGDTLLLRYDR
jgi:riboflavin biosynthesis pyrimidine reductase